jgi:hypothetical protein
MERFSPMMRRTLLILFLLLLAACGSAATQAPPAAPTGVPQATTLPPTAAPLPTGAPHATELPAPTDAPAPTNAAQQPSTPAATAPATGQSQGGVLVVYHKSGGIAGVDETLTVYADGRFELTDKRGATQTGQAGQAALDDLKQLLAGPEFAALDTKYQASGADLFTYKIEVPGAGKTVVTMDNAPTPPVLAQAIEKLEGLRGLGTPQAPTS